MTDYAKYGATIVGISALIMAYITGFFNKNGKLMITKTYSLASVSAALHFCNKPLIIGMMSLSYILLLKVLFKLQTKHTYFFAVLGLAIYVMILSLVFFIDNCDCSGTEYKTCCTPTKDVDMMGAGECTAADLRPGTGEIGQAVGDSGCCNPPWCTADRNKQMGHKHLAIALAAMGLALVFVVMIYNFYHKSWSPLKRKLAIGLIVAMVVDAVAVLATNFAGSKFDIAFYVTEGIMLPMWFLSMLLF